MDSTLKNRDRILEAIDQLRHRKARPDIQRICSYLFRRFHINVAEAKKDLEWCVSNNYVLKVEYKGNISYRNAAKKLAQMNQRRDNYYHYQQNNTTNPPVAVNNMNKNLNSVNKNFSELLTNVIGELIVGEPDYLEYGVPADEIIENILSKDSVRYTKNYVIILIEKEVERRNLIKMDNGNYLMGPPKLEEEKDNKQAINEWKREKTIKKNEDETNNGETGNVNNEMTEDVKENKTAKKQQMIQKINTTVEHKDKNEKTENMVSPTDNKKQDSEHLRIGGRRKKAKKVFDPSDTHVPKKRGRPAGSLNRSTIEKQLAKLASEEAAVAAAAATSRPDSRTSNSSGRDHGGVCSVCHLQNKKGPNDRMVACRECSNKAHFSCLNSGDDMMLKMYPDNTWQCPHCKTCVICYETSDAGTLTVCSTCADGYHANCHQPKIATKSGQKWTCGNCQMPDYLKINEIHSNIEHSFIPNKDSNNIDKDNRSSSSHSQSGNSSPSGGYHSPSLSPTPPQLSPQTSSHNNHTTTSRPDTPDQESDCWQSNKESEPEDPNIDPTIPDATHWTPDEVYQYFAQYFPEEAKIFKEQEIDGRSLLLLKRLDVLTNLNLKLGPALKIYKHVIRLQVRRDDKSLYYL